jgi:hypothetical protein
VTGIEISVVVGRKDHLAQYLSIMKAVSHYFYNLKSNRIVKPLSLTPAKRKRVSPGRQ